MPRRLMAAVLLLALVSAIGLGAQSVEALIAVLNQPTMRPIGDIIEPIPGAEEARATAMASLRAMGAPAVPALMATLAEPGLAGAAAAGLLAQINDPRAIPSLVQALSGPHAESVRDALIEMAHPTVNDAVAARIADTNPAVRHSVVLILVARRDQRVLPALSAIFATGEQYRRWEAVGWLTTLRPPDVRDRLRALLADDDYMVRSEAASRLGDVGDARDVDALIPLLKDTNERLRWGAARGLGVLRDTRALPALRAALAAETSSGNRQTITASIAAIEKK